MSKKRKTSKKKASGTARKPNRYNVLQRVLSDYGKEHNIKWAKGEFAKKCSKLNEKTKGFDIKSIAQNIDVIYKEYVVGVAIQKEYPSGEEFAWWNFMDEIKTPMFDNTIITFKFDDGFQEFGFSGTSEEAQLFWEDACYRYFRVHYSKSPWAYFLIEEDDKGNPKTDNKTYVDYIIIPGERQEQGEQKPQVPTPPPTKVGTSTQTSELIALEKEKQRTMDKVLQLIKAGYTKEEIFKIIGK
jgi:hypothetical protein